MSDDQGTLREIAWRELFPWLIIFRCFRLVLTSPGMWILSIVAMIGVTAGWRIADLAFEKNISSKQYTEYLKEQKEKNKEKNEDTNVDTEVLSFAQYREKYEDKVLKDWIIREKISNTPDRPWPWENSPHEGDYSSWRKKDLLSQIEDSGNILVRPAVMLSKPFRLMFRGDISVVSFACLLLCGLWALAVWALFGGAITRMAAVGLASDERVSMGKAIGHARSKWASYFCAPLFPIIVVLFIAGMMALLFGLPMRIPYIGPFVGGVLWFLMLLGGLIMGLMLLGVVFGWPLMWSTISAEGTEAFDAVSRSFAYVFQRPLQLLFYVVVALIFGSLCMWLVLLATGLVLDMSVWAVSWGAGNDLMDQMKQTSEDNFVKTLHVAGASSFLFWMNLVKLLAVAIAFSFFWTVTTAMYFLLRYSVDATEMDEVFMEEESEPLPALHTASFDEKPVDQQSTSPAEESAADQEPEDQTDPGSDAESDADSSGGDSSGGDSSDADSSDGDSDSQDESDADSSGGDSDSQDKS